MQLFSNKPKCLIGTHHRRLELLGYKHEFLSADRVPCLSVDLTITWRKAELVARHKEGASGKEKAVAAVVQEELVCLDGKDMWEPEVLSIRYQMCDSMFWMFETGRVRADQRKHSWPKRIQFDWKDKSTLLLCLEDRSVLQVLPGGRAMLRLWHSLWAS